jgi:hypothetical protein
LFRYRFETPKQTEIFSFGFTKQTETNAKQILFWFVSARTEIYFCLFRGHPTCSFFLRNLGVPLLFRLLLVELLQVTNNIGQLALTNRFLGGKYLFHGLTTFSSIWGGSRKGQRFLNFVVVFISRNNK